MKREQLLEKLKEYRWVPGHGPNIEKMSDEQLETLIKMLDGEFEGTFKDDE